MVAMIAAISIIPFRKSPSLRCGDLFWQLAGARSILRSTAIVQHRRPALSWATPTEFSASTCALIRNHSEEEPRFRLWPAKWEGRILLIACASLVLEMLVAVYVHLQAQSYPR